MIGNLLSDSRSKRVWSAIHFLPLEVAATAMTADFALAAALFDLGAIVATRKVCFARGNGRAKMTELKMATDL